MAPRENEAVVIMVDCSKTAESLDKVAEGLQQRAAEVGVLPHLRKRTHLAVYAFGTNGTNNRPNRQDDSKAFVGVQEIVPMGPARQKQLERIAELPKFKSDSAQGDFLEALAVAVDCLATADIPGGRMKRRVLMVTPCTSSWPSMEEEYLDALCSALLKNMGTVDVLVTPPGCDGADEVKSEGYKVAREAAAKCSGSVRMAENPEIDLMTGESPKSRPNKLAQVPLTIGDGSATLAECTQWKRTRLEPLPSLRKAIQREKGGKTEQLHIATTYMANDEAAQGSAHMKAHTYGADFVPIPEANYTHRMGKPQKRLELLGTLPRSAVPHYSRLGDVTSVLPKPGSEAAVKAVAEALERIGRVGLCGYCLRANGNSQVGLLAPEKDSESLGGLNLVKLPFKEEARQGRLPQFGHLVTEESKRLANEYVLSAHLGSKGMDTDSRKNPQLERMHALFRARALGGGMERVPEPGQFLRRPNLPGDQRSTAGALLRYVEVKKVGNTKVDDDDQPAAEDS